MDPSKIYISLASIIITYWTRYVKNNNYCKIKYITQVTICLKCLCWIKKLRIINFRMSIFYVLLRKWVFLQVKLVKVEFYIMTREWFKRSADLSQNVLPIILLFSCIPFHYYSLPFRLWIPIFKFYLGEKVLSVVNLEFSCLNPIVWKNITN